MLTVKKWIITPRFKLYFEATLPAKRIVCPCCHGEGMMVNAAIDGDGLTPEDMEDQDFRESYLNGNFDVRCTFCKGNKVIDVLDREALSPKMLKAVEKAEDEERRDAMDAKWERAWGA